MITGAGILASFFSVLFVHLVRVTQENVQTVLKLQIGISTVLMTLTVLPVIFVLPTSFEFKGVSDSGKDTVKSVNQWYAYGCILFGLYSGMVIGFITEYYTSNAYGPTLYLAESCKNGPAPNIIQGLALGYNSCIVPILCLTATIGFAF
jgi:inorganic pyrophosphatase